MLPEKIGDFRIEREIGRGGMGSVYAAISPNGTRVALKVLSRPENEDLLQRFQREASVQLRHPNIVEQIAHGITAEGEVYIAFELLEGESLAKRIARAKLTPREVVDLGTQIASGLSAAHALGIVHRDLKPANIFLCANGTAKLLDFGIAAFDESHTRLTMTGQIIGTPSYVSPEQARGEQTIDARSDVWSLAVVLYEALTRHLPFGGSGSIVATLLSIITDEPVPLAAVDPQIPPALGRVLERALAKSRNDRWPSAEAFARALAQAPLSGEAAAEPGGAPRSEERVIALLLASGVSDREALKRAVEELMGVFVPIAGERAVGVFGMERWEGDEAQRAAIAALEARKAAERIAISSGRAAVTGNHVAGAVLNDAERALEARVTGVAVSATVARLVSSLPLPEAAPGVFELTEDRRASIASGLSSVQFWQAKLLGRAAELAQLESALETALSEPRATTIVISGPTGIGKSRLAMELLRYAKRMSPPPAVLNARAEPRSKNTALRLLASAIRSRAMWGTLPALGSKESSESNAHLEVAKLAREAFGNENLDEATAFLGQILEVRMPATPRFTIALSDSTLMADRLRLVALDYLEALVARGPMVIVLEDLQWADRASLEVLRAAIESAEGKPLCVLLTARPELFEDDVAHWIRDREVEQIEPRPLPTAQVGELMRSILRREVDEALVRAVSERTAGNPLFVEQLALALDEDAFAASDPGRLPLPLSIEAAVQSRLDHLPPDEKDLLKRAAIYGRPFTIEELEALGVRDAETRLTSLIKRDLIRRTAARRGALTVTYRMESSLLAEVARRMLGEELRRELHHQAATAMVARSEHVDAEEIAQHFELGGDGAAAAQWFAEAAHRAAERGDNQAVIRRSDHALRLGLPAGERFRAYMERNEAFRFLGQREAQALALAAAYQSATSDVERARALNEEAFWLAGSDRAAEAIDAADRAVALARSVQDIDTLAVALGRKGMALAWVGRVEEAKVVLRDAGALADRASLRVRALAASWRAQVAAGWGDIGGALDGFRASLALHVEAGDERRAAGAAASLADTYNRVGAYRDAESALLKAIEGLRRVAHRAMEGWARVNLGYSLTMLGRFEEALETLDVGLELAAATQQPRLEVLANVYRARALLEHTDPREAQRVAEQAANRAEFLGAKGLVAAALTIAARGSLKLDEHDKALAMSSEAMRVRDQLGGIEEDEADVFLTHAEALIAAGKRDEARAVLLAGRKRLMAIAGGIGDADWRNRFLRDVPAHRFMLDRII